MVLRAFATFSNQVVGLFAVIAEFVFLALICIIAESLRLQHCTLAMLRSQYLMHIKQCSKFLSSYQKIIFYYSSIRTCEHLCSSRRSFCTLKNLSLRKSLKLIICKQKANVPYEHFLFKPPNPFQLPRPVSFT